MRFALNRNSFAAFHDAIMAGASFLLALYLRLGDATWAHTQGYLALGSGLFVVICVGIFSSMRLYRGLWRYASIQDLVTITKAVTFAVALFYFTMFVFTRLEGMPRSVPFIHWLLLLAMLGGPRFLYRVVKDHYTGRRFSLSDDRKVPVLLVGANDNAELFLRDTSQRVDSGYRVIGIVDDNRQSVGTTMHGVRIYGNTSDLATIVNKLARRVERPQRIILTDERIDGAQVRQLLEQADTLGIPLARLPRLTEFKSGSVEKPTVQPIMVEDLLGRAQNTHDQEKMHALIAGKTVMITGAGGTIGSELTRQVARFAPAKIVLFEQSEYNLYQIDGELADTFASVARESLIGDVRDGAYVDSVIARFSPDIVFHAAAIKHVPIAEANPEEALATNVMGTRHVADSCRKHKVGAMVLISTDKAVNPANVMGASKRLAESYCQALGAQETGTRFLMVRFGNVLGSTGSVVPLFQKQLAKGGPITITHPDMVRFFMTVREAVELVMQAAALGFDMKDQNGLIFVLDMGQAVRITDLAIQMIKLAGLRPDVDVQIIYSGLRPGEKLYEELFHDAENVVKTGHESIMLARPRASDLATLNPALALLKEACSNRDSAEALSILRTLVPEFQTTP